MKIGNLVNDAVDNISSSVFVKNVKMSANEAAENLAALARKNKISRMPIFGKAAADMGLDPKYTAEALHSKVTEAMEGFYDGLDREANSKMVNKLQKMFANGSWGNTDELYNSVEKVIGKKSGIDGISEKLKGFKETLDIIKDEVKPETVDANSVASRIGKMNYVFNMPKAYFNPVNADGSINKAVKSARMKGAFGAYAGITVGGRFLKGGSLTKDEYGQKDIAGIPFI